MICADCHRELLQTDYHGINEKRVWLVGAFLAAVDVVVAAALTFVLA
jgi:hypothetical protein